MENFSIDRELMMVHDMISHMKVNVIKYWVMILIGLEALCFKKSSSEIQAKRH